MATVLAALVDALLAVLKPAFPYVVVPEVTVIPGLILPEVMAERPGLATETVGDVIDTTLPADVNIGYFVNRLATDVRSPALCVIA